MVVALVAHLIVRQSDQISFSIPLEGPLRVGRHDDNDLVLGDARVSRRHAEIFLDGGMFVVRDLGSTHGIVINGIKAATRCLDDGDRIQIGSVLLTFRVDVESAATVEFDRTSPSLEQAPPPADQRLRLFYEICAAIGVTRDADTFLSTMTGALRDVLGCERAIVGLGQNYRDGIRKIVRSAKPDDDVVLSRSVLDAVLGRRERVVFTSKSAKDTPPTLVRQRIRAALCVPIVAGARVFGFVYVDDRRDTHTFAPEDVHFLTALACLAATVLDGAEQLRLADARIDALNGVRRDHAIIGESAAIVRLRQAIERCGPTSANVLVQGESGTGKELVAHALHAASPRATLPLVAVNCAAIPEALIESELFGHVRGAFTGAEKAKSGKFVLADKSTLFLDEIGDLSLAAQAKVLRAIQEGEVIPLGSDRITRVDVRIVAATHKDLRKEIAEKHFREDLYYRLAVVKLDVPPLREREGDVALLAQRLLPDVAASVGRRLSGITPRALDALRHYTWPGNVRELLNVLESAVIFSESLTIDVNDLEDIVRSVESKTLTEQTNSLSGRFAALDTTEKRLIIEALDKAEGNMSEAARSLGISWIMLKRRMARYGLLHKSDA